MADDCKPRIKVVPVVDSPLPSAPLCSEGVPPVAPDCTERLESPGLECCPDDSEERGWYNNPVESPCDEVVVRYGVYHSAESQEAADALADFYAYEALDYPPPDWESLRPEVIIVPPVDVYGALGPEELRSEDCVDACQQVAFCYGPTEEGATMVEISDRYLTRWQAKIEGGYVFYRKEGGAWSAVSTDLIPQPNLGLTGLGFCFDANARPCFSSKLGDLIYVWRFQGGIPTEYSFQGEGAKLFFNGVLQYDNTSWDVVCYYCYEGDLLASFQRENFGVGYTLFSDPDYYFCQIDRVDRQPNSERIYIEARCTNDRCGVFRSAGYPPWPVEDHDEASVAVAPVTGVYARVLVDVPGSSDAAAVTLGPVTGIYRPTILQLPNASDSAAVAVATVSGIHKLVLVQAGNYSDAAAVSVGAVTGIHKFTLIQVGSYSEATSLTVGPVTGVHAHV